MSCGVLDWYPGLVSLHSHHSISDGVSGGADIGRLNLSSGDFLLSPLYPVEKGKAFYGRASLISCHDPKPMRMCQQDSQVPSEQGINHWPVIEVPVPVIRPFILAKGLLLLAAIDQRPLSFVTYRVCSCRPRRIFCIDTRRSYFACRGL